MRGGRVLGAPEPVDVAVDADGWIAELSPHDGDRTAKAIVDATGCLVLPGLVEAHCHLDKTLFGRSWVPH